MAELHGTDLRQARRIHCIGIGGAGMCGIAEVLAREGHAVSGSDVSRSAATDRLARLGLAVRIGHRADAVADADLVVATSAVGPDNVEWARARQLGIPVLPRGAMLAELMRSRRGVAVAGSHGKTTTASMLASIFDAAGLDPTFVIGGVVTEDGGNSHHGSGPHLIAEADESDASFLHLSPATAVVTNIDRDHLGAYGQDFERLKGAFAEFAERVAPDGALAVCADDAGAAELARTSTRRTLTYGFAPDADCRADAVTAPAPNRLSFRVRRNEGEDLDVEIPMLGCCNAQNALGAIAAASLEGVADDAIVRGLQAFGGVRRRFEVAECALEGKRFVLVDDYGHHPTELRRVIDSIRSAWPARRLVMAYQPHRYTRTRDLLDDFAAVLAGVDDLVLLEVYAASEAPIAGADGRALAQGVERVAGKAPTFAATPEDAVAHLRRTIVDGDVVAIQGAGDVERAAVALRGSP